MRESHVEGSTMYLSAVPIRTPLTPSKCLDGSRFSDSLKIAFDDFSDKPQISFREVADDGSTTHEAEEDSTTRCVGVCGGCAVVIDVRDDSAMGPPLSVEEGTRHDMEGGQSSAIDRWRTTRMIVARVTSLQPPPPPPPLDRRGRGGHR